MGAVGYIAGATNANPSSRIRDLISIADQHLISGLIWLLRSLIDVLLGLPAALPDAIKEGGNE
jgi:hypothetical protein